MPRAANLLESPAGRHTRPKLPVNNPCAVAPDAVARTQEGGSSYPPRPGDGNGVGEG